MDAAGHHVLVPGAGCTGVGKAANDIGGVKLCALPGSHAALPGRIGGVTSLLVTRRYPCCFSARLMATRSTEA